MISSQGFQAGEIEVAHSGPAPAVTLVHLSDLHLRRWRRRHERLVHVVEQWAPDFVFITGDMIDQRPGSVECAARLVPQLKARYGVFAVRGNWEVGHGPPVRRLRKMLRQWGATLLVNEARTFRLPTGSLRLAGVDDPHRGWPDFAAAIEDAPAAAFTVLLCHGPVGVDMLPRPHGVDLMLAGHTHGGQIRLPMWRRMPYRFYRGWTDGLYECGPLKMHVSRGFGAVGRMPVRLACPAEVTLLRIGSTARAG